MSDWSLSAQLLVYPIVASVVPLQEEGKLAYVPKAKRLMAFWESKRKKNPSIKSSTLASYRSAITYYFNECGTPEAKAQRWGETQMRSISRCLKGMKNKGADLVRAGEATGEVGKKQLPITEFRKLALATLKLGPGGYLDGERIAGLKDSRHVTSLHVFSVLGWNLVMRCDSVTAIHARHLDWENDALHVGVNKSKRHDNEEFEYFRVYSNPFDAAVDPVLALAIHFACEPQILQQSSPLFPMSDPQSSLNRELGAMFAHLKLKGYGSHSLRKVSYRDR